VTDNKAECMKPMHEEEVNARGESGKEILERKAAAENIRNISARPLDVGKAILIIKQR